jgi:hypothetical protein
LHQASAGSSHGRATRAPIAQARPNVSSNSVALRRGELNVTAPCEKNRELDSEPSSGGHAAASYATQVRVCNASRDYSALLRKADLDLAASFRALAKDIAIQKAEDAGKLVFCADALERESPTAIAARPAVALASSHQRAGYDASAPA